MKTIETVPAGRLITFMVEKSHEFREQIEYMGYLTGTNDDYLNQFSVPNILGIASEKRDLLDKLIHFSGETEVMPAIDVDTPETGALHIKMSYVDPDDDVESVRFFPPDLLITPGGRGLCSYLSTRAIGECFPGVTPSDITDAQLASFIRKQGLPATTVVRNGSDRSRRIKTYCYLPVSLEVGQFGTRNSYYPSAPMLQRLLSPENNKFDSGVSYGDVHVHESAARKRATPEQRDMMDAIGKDYYRLPSSYDVVSFYSSRRRMANYGIEAENVVRGIVALTDHEEAAKRELLGTSFLDTRDVTRDPKTETELLARAEKANETKSFEDVRHYFDMVKSVTTRDLPDFIDTSVRGEQ